MTQTPVVSTDQVHGVERDPASTAREGEGTFTEAEYAENPEKIVAYAAATGCAVVVDVDGKPRVVITIPTADLPVLDD